MKNKNMSISQKQFDKMYPPDVFTKHCGTHLELERGAQEPTCIRRLTEEEKRLFKKLKYS